MTRPTSDREPPTPGRRLNRRQALIRSGASVVAGAAAAAAPRVLAAQEATPESSSAPPMTVTGEVTPERAAMAVDRIREYATQLLDESGVPGIAVAVVYNDEVLLAEGFGVRELGKDEPVDADTVFQLASVSKSIAATVVSSVVGDDTVAWDSKLSDIAPGFFSLHEPWPTENVTLIDLFSHRSGLADHAGDVLEDLGYSQAETFRRLRYLPPGYSFRAGYMYTNYGLTVAAEAAASAAGVPWPDLSRERLYAPLGMDHTSSLFSDYMAQPNRAIPHVRVDGTWQVTPQQRDPDNQTPAGGVSSTVNDLAKWMRLVLSAGTFDGQEVIPSAALTPVHVPHSVSNVVTDPANQRASFYGLGSGVSYTDFGTPQWSHSGAFALGAGTAYYMLPASGFGIVALTNGPPIGVPESLCLDVLDVAQLGEVSRDWFTTVTPSFVALAAPTYGTGTDWGTPPAGATEARPNSAYLGTYTNDFYGDVTVFESGDGLSFRIGPEPREFELTHYSRDTFSWQPTGENGSVRSGLTFTIGVDGTATEFNDEYLTWGGIGTLTRVGSDDE